MMAPLGGGSTDEWVAGVASYRAHQLRQQRRHGDASRRGARSKGDRRPEDAVDASRARSFAAASARRGAVEAHGESWRRNGRRSRHAPWLELRCASGPGHVVHGRTAAAGGRDGTAVRVELPASGRGGRGGRGAPASAPVIGYPRAYTVQVSADGSSWSTPVATGKGEGVRTTITFAPTRAKFVRITQTDAVTDAPAWSIRNLRIYEAPASKGGSK